MKAESFGPEAVAAKLGVGVNGELDKTSLGDLAMWHVYTKLVHFLTCQVNGDWRSYTHSRWHTFTLDYAPGTYLLIYALHRSHGGSNELCWIRLPIASEDNLYIWLRLSILSLSLNYSLP